MEDFTMKEKANATKIKLLEEDIESYERSLKKNLKNAALHHIIADNLVKLGGETGEQSNYDKALKYYDKAIGLSPQNQIYLLDRSKLYIILERFDLAIKDVVAAQQAPSTGERVLDMYSNNTTKDILKLSSVQLEVDKLSNSGQIPAKLKEVFSEMIGTILGISTRVSNHDNTLQDHEARLGTQEVRLDIQGLKLVQVEDKLAGLKAQYGQYQEAVHIITSLSIQVQELEVKVRQNTMSIQENRELVSAMGIELCTHEQFEGLLANCIQLEINQSLFGGRMRVLEGTVGQQKRSIATIDQTLLQANCYNKQQIKEGFAALKTEAPNGILYDYANHFYWSLSNYLLAYRAIASGTVSGVRDENQLEKIWHKVGSTIINVTEAIPIAGEFFAIIEKGVTWINNAYKDMKFDRKVMKVNELITGFVLEEDLNLAVANAAIQIARMKKDEIVGEYREKFNESKGEQKGERSTFQKAKDKIGEKVEAFNTKIDSMLAKMTKIKPYEDTTGKIMAIKDVILLINYIATNDVALISNQGDVSSLDKIITLAFTTNISTNTTDQAIHAAMAINIDQDIHLAATINTDAAKQDKCVVSVLNEIIYDNELLNHPELLKEATIHFGMNRALDLSELLDGTLLSEAIESSNQELILAGMMSLD